MSTDPSPALPDNMTCQDCAYFAKCMWLVQRKGDERDCDWTPSRFAFVGRRKEKPA